MSLLKTKESKAFKKIVAKRNLQIRRKAYADESLIQAKKKGKELAIAKAQKGTFGEKLRKSSGRVGKAIVKKALAPPKKKRTPQKRIKKITKKPATPLQSPVGFEGF